jgi:hypothetical protein
MFTQIYLQLFPLLIVSTADKSLNFYKLWFLEKK